MTQPPPDSLIEAALATWPAAACQAAGPWILRAGHGGGKRVSAASAQGPVTEGDILQAEAAMRDMNQPPLFMLTPQQEALDAMLADQGYALVDPVNVYVAPVADLAIVPPPVTAFAVWEPLAIQRDIWAEGGIGPARLAVMARAPGPKTALLGRCNGRAAATGFAAIHGRIAMVHALEVSPDYRRHGMGRYLVQQAALWAAEHGAAFVAALCTKDNAGSNALFSSLGMQPLAQYHYRQKG